MIERNVACCHACSAPLRHTGANERERGAPARTSSSRRVASRREESERAFVRYDSSSYDCSRNVGGERERETCSLSHYLSSLLITFPLLILVVRLFGSFVFVLAQFPLLSRHSFFSPSEVARWKCHRHRRARFPSFQTTTCISTKSFRRTPISARRGGTVARGKLQSSGIEGGSGGRGRGRKRGGRCPSGPVDTGEESRRDNLRPKKGKDRGLRH